MKLAKVKIRKGDGLQLAKQFKCSANWVSRSVNGTVNTEKAQKIRQRYRDWETDRKSVV